MNVEFWLKVLGITELLPQYLVCLLKNIRDVLPVSFIAGLVLAAETTKPKKVEKPVMPRIKIQNIYKIW